MKKLRKVLILAMCLILILPMGVNAAVPAAGDARHLLSERLTAYYASQAAFISSTDKADLDILIPAVAAQIIEENSGHTDYKYTDAEAQDFYDRAKARVDKAAGIVTVTPAEDTDDTETDTTPTTSNSNIMVGGTWVTPIAKAGAYVNVVLPVVNMGENMVSDAVVTPAVSSVAGEWPFEIEKSSYTQTIKDLPGTDDGGTDMERRRELTWTLKTRKDAINGYQKLTYNVAYHNSDGTTGTAALVTYVYVSGGTGSAADDGTASTPRVIVTGFSTSPEIVKAGDTFTLTLHMQNTSTVTAVRNMLFDIQAASESTDTTYVAAAFLPTAGSSTIFVDKIQAGGTKDISIEMEARSDLNQKPYIVTVNMDYEDEDVNAYKNTASVSIPVKQEARVELSTPVISPESLEVGSEANVMFSIYNTGKTKLYNATVKFEADSVTGGEAYLGNIEAGATGNVDVYLTGAAVTTDDGIVKIKITYEDEAGEVSSIEKDITLFVSEPFFDGGDQGMDGEVVTDETGGFKIWYAVIAGVVVAGIAVAVVLIKRRKKKIAALLVEENDDLLGEDEE